MLYTITGSLALPRRHVKLLEAAAISRRINDIAKVIDCHMRSVLEQRNTTPLVSVALLNGAAPFFAELRMRCYPGHTPINLTASSYRGQQSGDLVIDETALDRELIKRAVVYLIDDLVDSGKTMVKIKRTLFQMGASQVVTVVLLDKPAGREEQYKAFVPDVCGFVIPNAWVFGYGMDDGLGNLWTRNLPDIYCYTEKDAVGEVEATVLKPLPVVL